jgi:predicted HAD superfamily Cof-like phosphohydrolase
VAFLEELPREYGTDLLFPSPRAKKKLGQNAFVTVIERLDAEKPEGEKYVDPTNGRRITAHGFRSSFRDWGGERTAYPGDVLEMSLAHTIKNKAEAAYRRGDLLEKRHRLMAEENSEYLEAAKNNDLVEVADALGDQLYILCGTILKHGMQDLIGEVFEEIHRSNMSKLDENGKPIYREDGKVLKGRAYFKPNIKSILDK